MEIAKRFSSIDICKGLLIILVVMVHVPLALDRAGVDYPYVSFLTNTTCYFYLGYHYRLSLCNQEVRLPLNKKYFLVSYEKGF